MGVSKCSTPSKREEDSLLGSHDVMSDVMFPDAMQDCCCHYYYY